MEGASTGVHNKGLRAPVNALKQAGSQFGTHLHPHLQVCEESGTDLAQLVRKKVKVQQKQAATSQASTSATVLISILPPINAR